MSRWLRLADRLHSEIAVPRVDHLRPFHEQQEKVLSAFAAVERLLAIGRQIAATPSGT